MRFCVRVLNEQVRVRWPPGAPFLSLAATSQGPQS